MQTPPLPPDETDRLNALRCTGLLDTAPEERFDRITRLAKHSLRVPIALISLVAQQRQWFKSVQGLEGTTETSREVSFCGHTILGTDIFEVPNAADDLRFTDNPLVMAAPHIRFYAGVPLHDTNRYRIGTLCVIDRLPRRLTGDEKKVLHDLAAIAEEELARPFVEAQAHYAALLHHLNELTLTDYSNPQERYRAYLEVGCQALKMETGIVSHIQNSEYRVEASHSPLPGIKPGDVYPLSETYCAAVVQKQNTVSYEHIGRNPAMQTHPIYMNLKVETYIGVPIWVNRKLYGALSFSDRKPRQTPFFSAELQFASLLATALARAIEHQHSRRLQQQAHHALAQQKTLFESIFRALPDGVTLTDPERRILRTNPAAHSLFGYAPGELDGRKTSILYANEGASLQRVDEQYHPGKAAGSAISEQEYRRKDGTTFIGETVGSVIRTPDDEIFGYIEVTRDISARKEVERIKEEFVSTVSHELRTPLTSLSGSLGLVYAGVAGNLPEKATELVSLAYRNSERLISLVNDILDMERLSAGHIEFKMAPVDLREMLLDAEEVNLGYAERYDVKLTIEAPVPAVTVHVDQDRMHQVLTNLISNAVKFTPVGRSVVLSASVLGERIRIEIRDEGPGIPDSLRPRLFERFAQGDASDARQKSGTGLGLAISKAIVDAHYGVLGFEKNQPRGTIFFIELPLDADDCEATRELGGSGKVLICEDDPDDAAHLLQVVQKAGLQANVAASAEEAQTLFKTNQYDIITIDLWLPDGDGLSLIRNLRELDPKATFLVISRSKQPLTGIEGIKLLDWQTKPVDTVRLRRALKTALENNKRNCILHIEDDPDIRLVIDGLCSDLARVAPAGSLAEARSLLRSGLRPTAIILGLALPDGAGHELFELIRSEPAPKIPIVVFSDGAVETDVLTQADAVILKSEANSPSVHDTLAYLLDRPDTQ